MKVIASPAPTSTRAATAQRPMCVVAPAAACPAAITSAPATTRRASRTGPAAARPAPAGRRRPRAAARRTGDSAGRGGAEPVLRVQPGDAERGAMQDRDDVRGETGGPDGPVPGSGTQGHVPPSTRFLRVRRPAFSQRPAGHNETGRRPHVRRVTPRPIPLPVANGRHGMDAIREMYARWAAGDMGGDDQWGDVTAEPRGVDYLEVSADGVPAMWLRPHGAPDDRVIVALHGGGFVGGSLYTHRKMYGHLAKRAGVPVLLATYRMAPETPVPGADRRRGDRVPVGGRAYRTGAAVAGDSSGGGLAVQVALRVAGRGRGAARCRRGWTWTGPVLDTYESSAGTDLFFTRPMVQGLIGAYLPAGVSGLDPAVNALHADLSGLPPVYVQCGGEESGRGDRRTVRALPRRPGSDSGSTSSTATAHVPDGGRPLGGRRRRDREVRHMGTPEAGPLTRRSSRSAADCSRTRTGCSARFTRPRTSCRTPTASVRGWPTFDTARRYARGSTGSPPTPACPPWTAGAGGPCRPASARPTADPCPAARAAGHAGLAGAVASDPADVVAAREGVRLALIGGSAVAAAEAAGRVAAPRRAGVLGRRGRRGRWT